MEKTVTTHNDSGPGSLRDAIIEINKGSDTSNIIYISISIDNPLILLQSDLPVIKKNIEIISRGQRIIDGGGKYRLFATIMANLSLKNCKLQHGAAIGGEGEGGGLGAGGGVYIDRGNTLTLTNCTITSCRAEGGEGTSGGGGGASFSSANKNSSYDRAGGDYPGVSGDKGGKGGAYDGSSYLHGYGGGSLGKIPGGGDGAGGRKAGIRYAGYCGGATDYGGSGGNPGGDGYRERFRGGGGGFGSGGGYFNSGGGFGGGGTNSGSGGFGGGGGSLGKGGRFGGDKSGGGAGIGGAIFVGDTATCIVQDDTSLSNNQALPSKGSNPGQGYAPEIFLFRKAKIRFNNLKLLKVPYSIMGDQEAPDGHLDSGIVKQGVGTLLLSNTANNFRGGVRIQGGILSIADPKVIGSPVSPIHLEGGTLQVTKSITLTNPIVVTKSGAIYVPKGIVLATNGAISGVGIIRKEGNGVWKHNGSRSHTVRIKSDGLTKKIVTTHADSGAGSLRQAIIDINNNGSTRSNTIDLQIAKNIPIIVQNDLPVINKDLTITATGKQPIDGQGKYRLFATIMADLSLINCIVRNGAAIGGDGGGGGMGAGGGVYIDRGNTLTLINVSILSCKAQGGEGKRDPTGGGGASFSFSDKNANETSGGGDFAGINEVGGKSDGSRFLTGYGGGDGGGVKEGEGGKGGGNGPGKAGTYDGKFRGGDGGYCGGGGHDGGGGGGDPGGDSASNRRQGKGGGGFGSGGGGYNAPGGGGFGGGGGSSGSIRPSGGGGGGFGGGGGGATSNFFGQGGRYGGAGNQNSVYGGTGGGGAGLGGAIFIGDSARVLIEDKVIVEGNSAVGGIGANPGEGYAQDVFLFRIGTLHFHPSKTLIASFAIQADVLAPRGHWDNGIVKSGPGLLYLTNRANNYRGGTLLKEGIVSIDHYRVIGSPTSPIHFSGGMLQVTKAMVLKNPMRVTKSGTIEVAKGVILHTFGKISGRGTLYKTGDGVWNHYGDCSLRVKIYRERGIVHTDVPVSLKESFIEKNPMVSESFMTGKEEFFQRSFISKNHKKPGKRDYFF